MNLEVRSLRQAMVLRDGTPALLRPIRPDDRERLQTAFLGLDPESVYLRFFSYKRELSEADLDRFCNPDCNPDSRGRVLLVVTRGEGSDEVVIGSGSYVVLGTDRRAAEVAFTVKEDYHGQGIAGALLSALAGVAARNGIERLAADVLPRNVAMRRVFARSGLPMREEAYEDVLRVSLSLSPTSPAGACR